jgi:hypothetical protein
LRGPEDDVAKAGTAKNANKGESRGDYSLKVDLWRKKKSKLRWVKREAKTASLEQGGIRVFVLLGLLGSINKKIVYGLRRLYIQVSDQAQCTLMSGPA